MKEAEPEDHEFASVLRRISKPIIIAANKIDLADSQSNLEKINKGAIPCSAESELALREADSHGLIKYVPGSKIFEHVPEKLNEKQEEALNFIKKNVLEKYGSTGIQDCLNKLVFEMLDQIVVYPVANINKFEDNKGNVLPDAHLVRKGTTLKEFAAKIHTDLADSFIGGLDIDRKKIGADYELRNGDVVEILLKK